MPTFYGTPFHNQVAMVTDDGRRAFFKGHVETPPTGYRGVYATWWLDGWRQAQAETQAYAERSLQPRDPTPSTAVPELLATYASQLAGYALDVGHYLNSDETPPEELQRDLAVAAARVRNIIDPKGAE